MAEEYVERPNIKTPMAKLDETKTRCIKNNIIICVWVLSQVVSFPQAIDAFKEAG